MGTAMLSKVLPIGAWFAGALLASLLLVGVPGAARAGSPALDFNRDIRPILAENCFYCHGQDANKRQADLRLDVRDAAIESGAIVPNDAAGSELIARIRSDERD